MKTGEVHLTFQNQYMKKCLLDVSTNYGRGMLLGVLTDSTFSYFRRGYLLSSCVYSGALERWIPVLVTWLDALNIQSQAHHFKVLISQILERDHTENMKNEMMCQVLDFSESQFRAFIDAYLCALPEKNWMYR